MDILDYYKMALKPWMLFLFCGIFAHCHLSVYSREKNCPAGQFGWDCQLSCHCAGSDQCNTNDGECPWACAEAWAGPKCQIQTENVAKDKPTTQTETKYSREARFAVDGVIDQQSNYSYAITRADNSTVWWQVDLGGFTKIRVIRVYFAKPDTAYMKKLRGTSLKIFNSSEADAVGDLCYQDFSRPSVTPPSIVNLTDCSSGSILRLYNSRNTAQDTRIYSVYPQLLISEVQVIADTGCAQGSYGSECEKVCGRCQAMACNRDDGACAVCLPGWYGNGCQQQCSSSCPSNKCNKATGYCTEPCDLGFYGNWCNETCSNDCERGCGRDSGKCTVCSLYRYGNLCEKICSNDCKTTNCPGRICDRDSGHCSCGCKDTMFGPTCDDHCRTNCIQCDNFDSCFSCVPDHWGKRCEKPCAIDCFYQQCVKDSGKCIGCDGFRYGDMCEKDCPRNCEGLLCYRNGTCQKGCTDHSYFGDRCNIPCSRTYPSCTECHQNLTGDIECLSCLDGWHGSKCELTCPKNCVNCRNNSLCTQCDIGFTGELCDTPCAVQHCFECYFNGTCRVCLPGRYGHDCDSECNYCETCSLNDSDRDGYSCLSCKKGKYLSTSRGRCFACNDHCESCVSPTNCMSCKDGYHGTICNKKCPENCVSCLSDKECTSCNSGWTGIVCQCNMKNCITDLDQSKWCAADGTCLNKGCRKGFWGVRCQSRCNRNCLSCEQYGGKCLKCAAGMYGADCNELCSANCAEKDMSGAPICRFRYGSCYFCDNGWYTDKCDVPCNENCLMSGGIRACHQLGGTCESCKGDKYGPSCNIDCAQNCRDRFGVNSCYMTDGTCLSCVDGYYGVYCNKSCSANCKTSCEQISGRCDECISNHYDKFCEKRCPSNCGIEKHSKMIVCNRYTGKCLFCKEEGYYGEICHLPCSQFCTQGTSNPVCEKADGHCLSCREGYYGDMCNLPCSQLCTQGTNKSVCERATGHCLSCKEGYYGEMCNVPCSQFCTQGTNKSVCERVTGHCLSCKVGYYGETCNLPCSQFCTQGTDKPACDKADGKCSEGCVSGYRGDNCSLLASAISLEKGDSSSSLADVGLIVGLGLGLAGLVGLIVIVTVCYKRRKSRRLDARVTRNNAAMPDLPMSPLTLPGSSSSNERETETEAQYSVIQDNDETKDRNITKERTTIQPQYEQLARCGGAGENLYSVCSEGSDTEGINKMRSSNTDSEYLIPLSQHSEIDGRNENNVYYDSSCAMVDENETADRSSTNDADKYMNISVPIISLK